jgi:DNA-binding response OmpR family regulator
MLEFQAIYILNHYPISNPNGIMIDKILIIEDEYELSHILKKYLQRRHYKVDCADTLVAGLDMAATQHFQFVILDNNLPDGQGIEHIDKLKMLQPNVCIIAMSALRIKELAHQAGAHFFVEKPISLKNIENILAQSKDTVVA